MPLTILILNQPYDASYLTRGFISDLVACFAKTFVLVDTESIYGISVFFAQHAPEEDTRTKVIQYSLPRLADFLIRPVHAYCLAYACRPVWE
jgi:hypothetical protein